MNQQKLRADAHKQIEEIFETLLPARGLSYREAQAQLSHTMLDALLDGKIALCDAGTAIGKTFSYLVAGAVFDQARCRDGCTHQPLIISTSSIALQRAVKYEYLPLLSSALLDAGYQKKPLLAVIRKGRSHYVCDQRLEKRLRQLNGAKKNAMSREALEHLQEQLDLDEAEHLSDYDRSRVCVPKACSCRREYCRYRAYLQNCDSPQYLFQICNHNLLFADAMHRSQSLRPIFPEYCGLIVDESHRLPEVARQMLGISLEKADIDAVIYGLKMERYQLAAEYLEDAFRPLLERISVPPEGQPFNDYAELLKIPYQVLSTVESKLLHQLSHLLRRNLQKLRSVISTLLDFEHQENLVCYAEESQGSTRLCATLYDLGGPMKKLLWNRPQGMILTSGTMAVGTDFQRFRTETGLTDSYRVIESVWESPFDYLGHALLYLPEYPPLQFGGRQDLYYDALAGEIARLIRAASGHTLVLFTSYSAMSAVKERLLEQGTFYPLLAMGHNPGRTMQQFQEMPGAVLLATGSAWEGMDFPGDMVSLLVIPKLPFPYPNELKEKQKEQYASLQEFINSVVLPEMQIKLRQGFGRAIRTETDTCVVAVLDERCAPGKRYYEDLKNALPDGIPETNESANITEFMLDKKHARYFTEADNGYQE